MVVLPLLCYFQLHRLIVLNVHLGLFSLFRNYEFCLLQCDVDQLIGTFMLHICYVSKVQKTFFEVIQDTFFQFII